MSWVVLSTFLGIISAILVGVISGFKQYTVNKIRDAWIKENINEISKEIHHFLSIPKDEWDKNIFQTRQKEILDTCYRILKNLGLKNVRVSIYTVSETEVPPPFSEYANDRQSEDKSTDTTESSNHIFGLYLDQLSIYSILYKILAKEKNNPASEESLPTPKKILAREATSEQGFRRSKPTLIIKKTDDQYNTFNVLDGERPSQVKRKFTSRLHNYLKDKNNNQVGKNTHWIYSLRIPLKPENQKNIEPDILFRVLIADTADNRSFPDAAIQLMVFMGQILELTRIHVNHSPNDPKAIDQAAHKNGLDVNSANKPNPDASAEGPTNEQIIKNVPDLHSC